MRSRPAPSLHGPGSALLLRLWRLLGPRLRNATSSVVFLRAADGCIAPMIRQPIRASPRSPAALLLPRGIGLLVRADRAAAAGGTILLDFAPRRLRVIASATFRSLILHGLSAARPSRCRCWVCARATES